MDYSPFVHAIRDGDDATANELIARATPVLIRYLKVRMGASDDDAKDAVQKMFLYIIESIKDDKIQNPSGLLSYMLKTCRHNYTKTLRRQDFEIVDESVDFAVNEPEQIDKLLDKERKRILQRCLELLNANYREFITHWLIDPSVDAEKIADKYNTSAGNIWTRKHRVIKQLNDCVKKKLKN
jgi:RNA polymerase sigma factor (sigma-70 family)